MNVETIGAIIYFLIALPFVVLLARWEYEDENGEPAISLFFGLVFAPLWPLIVFGYLLHIVGSYVVAGEDQQ